MTYFGEGGPYLYYWTLNKKFCLLLVGPYIYHLLFPIDLITDVESYLQNLRMVFSFPEAFMFYERTFAHEECIQQLG